MPRDLYAPHGDGPSEFRCHGLKGWELGFRVWGLTIIGVQGSGFTVQGLGFTVQGSGFTVQGLGFAVQGLGFIEIKDYRFRA